MNEETIFAVAREKKTPAERQAYLDQACAKNTVVRATVEELLRADDDAGSFLEHAPAGMEATVASEASSRDTVDDGLWATALPFLKACDKPGRIGLLDQYEIIEVVGHGGMGAVLRAFDSKLSRVVAVKVMAEELPLTMVKMDEPDPVFPDVSVAVAATVCVPTALTVKGAL